MKYFKSRIVPPDQSTTVYWCEDDAGKARDILPENIPKDAKIMDVTWEQTTAQPPPDKPDTAG